MKTNYETLVELVIKAETGGKPRHELVLEICDTPVILMNLGVSPLRVVIKAKTIGKIFFDHGLTQRQIARIPAILNEPQAIYTSASHPDSVVVFTYETHAGAPIIIPVAKNCQIGRSMVNEVVSMYGKPAQIQDRAGRRRDYCFGKLRFPNRKVPSSTTFWL